MTEKSKKDKKILFQKWTNQLREDLFPGPDELTEEEIKKLKKETDELE